MKNIYKISKTQIGIIIIFSFVGELLLLDYMDYAKNSEFYGFLAFVLPFVVIFYIAGWRHHNLKDKIK